MKAPLPSFRVALAAPAVLAILAASPALAGIEIGDVQLVKEQAFGTPPDAGKRTLKPQITVFENESVETARDSAAHLHFKDDTVLRVGSASKVTLDHMVYDPSRGTGELAVTLSQGAFRYISGKIKNEKVAIKTPTATIGVRGTDITVLVFKDGSTQLILNDNSQASIQSIAGGAPVQLKKGEQGTVIKNQPGAVVGEAPPFSDAFTPDSGLLDSAGIGSSDKTTATATQAKTFPDLAAAANATSYKPETQTTTPQPPLAPPPGAGQTACNAPCGVPASFGTANTDGSLSHLPLGPGGAEGHHGHHGRLGAWTSPWGGGFRFAGGMSAFGQLIHALLHDGLEAGLATALGSLPPPNPGTQLASLNTGSLSDASGTRATDAVANTATTNANARGSAGVQVAQTIGSVFPTFFIQIRWGSGAHDLDLHLTGPNGDARFHVYYGATQGPGAKLNQDCVCTAGSEVITVSQLNQGGPYRASVYNFGDQSTTSTNLSTNSGVVMTFVQGGTVGSGQNGGSVVNGGTAVATVTPTSGQAGNTWVAATVNPANGKVTPVNTITNSANSASVQ
ncbi:MAG: FecR domain-containing protein [Alphaproteobacteria bacterium]